jgi:hypothetical protein
MPAPAAAAVALARAAAAARHPDASVWLMAASRLAAAAEGWMAATLAAESRTAAAAACTRAVACHSPYCSISSLTYLTYPVPASAIAAHTWVNILANLRQPLT